MGGTVAIIDYGSGNLHSAEKAFRRMGAPLGVETRVTAEPDVIAAADHIVLPGVGAFGDCAAGLRAAPGVVEALERRVRAEGRPFLGICVGMQLMADEGLERGAHAGLGWTPGVVDALRPADAALKIPHMGWNKLRIAASHPVLDRLPETDGYAYFVHSFHMTPTRPEDVLATADHGGAVTAIVGRDNLIGTQFHPEKSQGLGLTLIEDFLRWRP